MHPIRSVRHAIQPLRLARLSSWIDVHTDQVIIFGSLVLDL